MGQTPRVSVCVPTYNGERFVAEALRSVLDQDEDFELIVVDDGSTDETLSIARSFDDRRLRVREATAHRGIPANWNFGVGLTRGELVCVFHQDDVMLPGNLRTKADVLAGDPAMSFVHSAVELLVEPPATPPAPWVENSERDIVVEGEVYFRRLLLGGNRICAPAVVARRDRLLAAGGFDESLGYSPDYEAWMKLCLSGRVGFLARPLIRYRWHGENESHAFRFERGAEEVARARKQAVARLVAKPGSEAEAELLSEALAALEERERWSADLGRLVEEQRQQFAELERAHQWAESERASWQRASEEQGKFLSQLEEERAALKEERAAWQRLAEDGQALMQKQERRIAEQERSIAQQAQGLDELARWIAELDRGRSWLEEQRAAWQRSAEHEARQFATASQKLDALRGSLTWRLRGRLLRLPGVSRLYRTARRRQH